MEWARVSERGRERRTSGGRHDAGILDREGVCKRERKREKESGWSEEGRREREREKGGGGRERERERSFVDNQEVTEDR
jgi:hypothetical protein